MKLCSVVMLLMASGILTFGQDTPVDPFTVVISTRNPVVKSGEEIEVKIALTNTSDKELSIAAVIDSDTGLSKNYRFEIRGSNGKLLAKKAYPPRALPPGEVEGPSTVNNFSVGGLKPGATSFEERSLMQAYDLEAPDTYHIQLVRYVPGNPKHPGVRSNTITVTVTP